MNIGANQFITSVSYYNDCSGSWVQDLFKNTVKNIVSLT